MPEELLNEIERRTFLKLMAASLALASGCSRKLPQKIVPYDRSPEQLAAGDSLYFATATSLDGYGTGVLVRSEQGRPIKIEGNPQHPASLGASDIFGQASILTLWDPQRSQSVLNRGEVSTWDLFRGALADERVKLAARQGEGLHVLTGSISSPTLAQRLQALLAEFPRARWHQYQSVNRDRVYAGTELAFGARLEPRYRFDRARIIVALDADFLSAMPGHLRYARDSNGALAPGSAPSARNRLYCIESTPTLTGAKADHRRALPAGQIDSAVRALAAALKLPHLPKDAGWRGIDPRLIDAIARELRANPGDAVVVAGDHQPAHVHALVHQMNDLLGNAGRTVEYLIPIPAAPVDQSASLSELHGALRAGAVTTLLILNSNPAYAAPFDLGLAELIDRVPFSAHLGLHRDETARACRWHIPGAHELEAWSDVRAFDGTASIQQPLIAPLYGGRTALQMIAALGGALESDDYTAVRSQWHGDTDAESFESRWSAALNQGIVEGTAFAPQRTELRAFDLPQVAPLDDRIEINFRPDPCLHDGSFASNAWLQELPKPLTELTWDNAAIVSPALAVRLGATNGQVVELELSGRTLRAPVWILRGQPEGSVTLHLGYGRRGMGEVADARGFNAFALQPSSAPGFVAGARLHVLPIQHSLACTQLHHSLEGRDLARSISLANFIADGQDSKAPARTAPSLLYPPFDSPSHAWAMSINLDACIGCKACTIACQAENNIPVVGREQVLRGREMHWIRVDSDIGDDGSTLFQPVPCMHCERAPCEVVCPVEASIHDSDGLNLQVYNRCVGTRFCSNNCPYKVRRFNFLQYAQDVPSLNAQRNPDVTVRMRGVMEKCSYCIQRISAAKIQADRSGQPLRDGDVITACQAACPTQAIVFGDLKIPHSAVRQAKAARHDYALLAELNTLPRTTYLPAVRNRNPSLGED